MGRALVRTVLLPKPPVLDVGELRPVRRRGHGPTVWRTLEALTAEPLAHVATARAAARQRVWADGMDPGFDVIDIDGSGRRGHAGRHPGHRARLAWSGTRRASGG